jgi:hypothetical protein
MDLTRVGRLPALDRLCYWIVERNHIWERRQQGQPKPWTDDPILQTCYFTNPYRERDKTTVWFEQHVRGPLRHSPDVFMATIIFRWFNWIPTGELLITTRPTSPYGLLTDWDWKHAYRVLADRIRTHQVFTGAYMISNRGGHPDKVRCMCAERIQPLWQDRHKLLEEIRQRQHSPDGFHLQDLHTLLGRYAGLGGHGFTAYELVRDFRWTWLLAKAKDTHTWSNPGPGALRGLNRLLGRSLSDRCLDWQDQSRLLLSQVQARLTSEMPAFEMSEIEHSLCEWDKYERARLGTGRIKRKYNGT